MLCLENNTLLTCKPMLSPCSLEVVKLVFIEIVKGFKDLMLSATEHSTSGVTMIPSEVEIYKPKSKNPQNFVHCNYRVSLLGLHKDIL